MNELYEDLPILVIDSWDDISEEFLREQYKKITSRKYDMSKLYMEYWIEKIDAVRNRFKAEYELRPELIPSLSRGSLRSLRREGGGGWP